MAKVCLRIALLCCAMTLPLSAQALRVSDEMTMAGSPVAVSVTVDLSEPILGCSFGVRHDAARLTPTSYAQGAALVGMNGGAGAEYFEFNVTPANGPGSYLATVFTLSFPFATIPAGVDHEVAVISYNSSAGSAPGSSTALTLAADLGDPMVGITLTNATATSLSPLLDNGTVTFDVPPPTGFTCTLVDSCICSFDLNWSNPTAYTSVEVRRDGTLIATLPGNATSFSANLPVLGSTSTFSVRGAVGAIESTDTNCLADCPAVVPAPVPSGFTCTVSSADPMAGCTVDVSWTLEGTYTSFAIFVDGVLFSNLPGTATSDSVSLAVSANAQQICLEATDECGDPLTMNVCCDVTCNPGIQLIRGDCNSDGLVDLADTIFELAALFTGGGPVPCEDSCDLNDDGVLDISDGIYNLLNLFGGGAPPAAPFPACGVDPTDTDTLGCSNYTAC